MFDVNFNIQRANLKSQKKTPMRKNKSLQNIIFSKLKLIHLTLSNFFQGIDYFVD